METKKCVYVTVFDGGGCLGRQSERTKFTTQLSNSFGNVDINSKRLIVYCFVTDDWIQSSTNFLRISGTNRNNYILCNYLSKLPYRVENIFCCYLATKCHVNNSVQATDFRRRDSTFLDSQYKYRTYMRKRKKKCRLIEYKGKETSSKHKSCYMNHITCYPHSACLYLGNYHKRKKSIHPRDFVTR